MGPVAQDFSAAFGLGETDTMISTVDADGVALAAIQGLNAKLEHQLQAKDAEINSLKAEVAEPPPRSRSVDGAHLTGGASRTGALDALPAQEARFATGN